MISKKTEVRLYPKLYKLLRHVHKKTASKFWRWAVWRIYPSAEHSVVALICPPHLWVKDPMFHWREEGGSDN